MFQKGWNRKKIIYLVAVLMIGMLLLGSCGRNPQGNSNDGGLGAAAFRGTGNAGTSGDTGETDTQLPTWKVVEYRKIELPHPEGYTEYDGWFAGAVDEENYYLLVYYREGEDKVNYYLYQIPLEEGDIIGAEVNSYIRWGERPVISAEQFPGLVSEAAIDYGTNPGGVVYIGGADSSEVLREVCPSDQQSFLEAAVKNSAEEYVLIFRDKTGHSIYRYRRADAPDADGEFTEERVIVIESTNYGSQSIQEAAAVYTRTHPGITVVYKRGEFADREDTWTRMTMELATGGGADILLVEKNQLNSILDSGLLADMNFLIPDDVRAQIYPGLLEAGCVEGKLYSLITDAWTYTLFADKKVWKKDSWTLDDVIPMLNGTDREFVASASGNSGEEILQQLLLYDLEHSKFLNFENGTCDFNSKDFQELLMLCKKLDNKMPDAAWNSLDDGKEMSALMSGAALAYEGAAMSFKDYCRIRDLMGDDYFVVGYPAENGHGSYWNWDYSLVVNGSSENMDVVQDILLMLLEQSNVKRDTYLDGKVIEDWDGVKYYTLNKDVNNWFYPIKEDGIPYVEEYMEYLDGCVPFPLEADYIRTIIQEEAAPFFNGDKDVKTVCGIIQNRAQLYLDER